MLTPEQAALWEAYQKAEARGARSEKVAALEEFLAVLEGAPQDQWEPWARDVARRVVDAKEDIAIRMPLFRRVVFPALLSGLLTDEPGCARWLAGLSRLLDHCPDCAARLPEDLRTKDGLLRRALRQYPGDSAARLSLIALRAYWFQYALHELPAGVLYNTNGATVEQCDEMRGALDEFVSWVEAAGERDRYAGLIDHCRLHFDAYRDYLLCRPAFPSYADYLTRHGLPDDPLHPV